MTLIDPAHADPGVDRIFTGTPEDGRLWTSSHKSDQPSESWVVHIATGATIWNEAVGQLISDVAYARFVKCAR